MENTIAVELLKREVEANIIYFENKTKILNDIKYNKLEINKKLEEEFNCYIEILQNIVNSFYWSYYEVKKFINIDAENIDFAIEENKKTLLSISKLIKFIE